MNGFDQKQAAPVVNTTMPISGILGVAFVVLKLMGFINWSWWWVTLPFWGGIALVLSLLAIFGVGFLIYWLITK